MRYTYRLIRMLPLALLITTTAGCHHWHHHHHRHTHIVGTQLTAYYYALVGIEE